MKGIKMNDAGLKLLKSFEGCSLVAYKDIVGKWTIGFGHCDAKLSENDSITQEQADELLQKDLGHFEEEVRQILEVDVSENQFAALVCFAYNVGLGSLYHSHLLSKLNSGDISGAADEFLRWDRAGGVVVPGLLRRREAERNLFLS